MLGPGRLTMAALLLLAALLGVASGGAEVQLLGVHAIAGGGGGGEALLLPVEDAVVGGGGAEAPLLSLPPPAAGGGAEAPLLSLPPPPAAGGGAEAPLLPVGSPPPPAAHDVVDRLPPVGNGAQEGALRRQLETWPPAAHAIVAVGVGGCGGGGARCYNTISKALDAAPHVVGDEKRRYVILVKAGEYKESVTITRKNVVLLGEGAERTVITASKNNASGTLMNETATINAFGHGFLAQDLTIRNAAGPSGRQAVALRSNSNKSVVYRCRIEGFEDTLYAENGRQFYIESVITGTVDFVFGNARAVFQKCRLQVRRPLDIGKHNVITAQGRNNASSLESGFAFHECVIEAEPGHDLNGIDTFLGRPYRNYSHVAFVNSFIGGVVNATGWVPWNRSHEIKETTETVEYIEFGNKGPGADTARRVHWPGLRILSDVAEAAKYTPDRFIDANLWVPKQIPYDHSLGAPPLVPGGGAA